MRLAILVLLLCSSLAWFAPESHAGKPPFLNAGDYPSIQAAIDALGKEGGTVLIPPGQYDQTTVPAFAPPLQLPVRVRLRVVGAGRDATILQSRDPNKDLCLVQGSFQSVEQLTLSGAAHLGLKGRGNGVVIGAPTGDKTSISNAALIGVVIRGAPQTGLYVKGRGSPGDSLAILCTYDRVFIDTPDGDAVVIEPRCTTQFFRDCAFIDFRGYGARVGGVGHQFSNCDFEQSPAGPPSKEFLLLERCTGADIRNCWFEDQRSGKDPAYFIRTRTLASHINIESCTFSRFAATRVRGILIEPWMQSLTITNPQFSAHDAEGSPFDTREQITARGYAGSLTDDKRVSATIIGGVTATARAYYPVVMTDSLRAGEKAQPGITRVNPQGAK
jgi:hypothetical protein